jgi:hypothetical protein
MAFKLIWSIPAHVTVSGGDVSFSLAQPSWRVLWACRQSTYRFELSSWRTSCYSGVKILLVKQSFMLLFSFVRCDNFYSSVGLKVNKRLGYRTRRFHYADTRVPTLSSICLSTFTTDFRSYSVRLFLCLSTCLFPDAFPSEFYIYFLFLPHSAPSPPSHMPSPF